MASGSYAHAEGNSATASSYASHAEGHRTLASGISSHAGGFSTIAQGYCQTAIGSCNIADTSSLFIIGNGTSASARSNAMTLSEDGILTLAGGLRLPAGTAAQAPLRIPAGVAPTSPVNGDIWSTTSDLLYRLNSVTRTVPKLLSDFGTIPTGWTGPNAQGYYTKPFTATGVLATDNVDITRRLNMADKAAADLIQEAWNKVTDVVISANMLTFYAKTAPTVAIPIFWKVVR